MAAVNNPVPDPVNVEGLEALMSLACQKCRTVYFARQPETAVKLGISHAQECGTGKILIAELVTAAIT